MALVIPPGFADIAIEFVNSGDPDPWYITFGVDSSAAEGDMGSIGNRCINAFGAAWDEMISTDTTITGCFVTLGQDAESPLRQYVPAAIPYVGTNTGGKLPQNCALLVRKNTATGGRRARGRYFMPGVLNEAAVDNVGRIDAMQLTDLQERANAAFTGLTSVGNPPELPMVLLHSTGISATIPPTPIISVSVDSVISTQRRRLR